MNKGSLFDLMERQPQPEQQPVVQNRTQPQPQQVMQPQPAYAPARQAPASRQPQRQAPMQQPERPEFGQPPVQQTQQQSRLLLFILLQEGFILPSSRCRGDSIHILSPSRI